MAKSFNELRAKMSPEQQEQAKAKTEAIIRMLPLYELRLARKLSQAQLAETMHVNQAAVSKMERRADIYISTLRRYVEAVGGKLVISADFPDGRVNIDLFREIGESDGE